MKKMRAIICLLVSLGCGVGLCETKIGLSDIQQTEFSRLTIEEARVIARKASNTPDKSVAHAFVQAAVESGRFEVMDLCWEEDYTRAMISEMVLKMPDSHMRDQLVSRRFRSTRYDWPAEDQVETASMSPRMQAVTFFVPFLRKYIPDLPMNYSVMNSREKRLKLADAFDKAAGIPIEVEPEARRVWPPKSGEKPNMSAKPVESRDDGGNANVPAAVAAIPKEELLSWWSGRFAIYAAVTVVLAGIAGWFALRSRQGKR